MSFLIPGALLLTCIIYFFCRSAKTNDWDVPKRNFAIPIAHCIGPWFLMFLRIFFLGVAFTTLLKEFVDSGGANAATFTVLSFLIYAFTLVLGVIISIKYLLKKNDFEYDHSAAGGLEKTYQVLLEVVCASMLFITSVVWIGLDSRTYLYAHGDVSEIFALRSYVYHLFSLFMLFAEVMLNGIFFKFYRVLFVFVWGVVYIFLHTLVMISNELNGELHCPEYSFLSMDKPQYSAFLIMILVLLFISYTLWFFLTILKRACLNSDTCCRCCYLPQDLESEVLPGSNKSEENIRRLSTQQKVIIAPAAELEDPANIIDVQLAQKVDEPVEPKLGSFRTPTTRFFME